MKKVNVLLSSYNGAEYLGPQLLSIAQQDYPSVKVHIRDDGSKDSSCQVVERCIANRPEWTLEKGSHIGVFNSFMSLLSDADKDCSFFAFCDQDDVWLPDKLSRAAGLLDEKTGPGRPALYFSRMVLVNSKLRRIGESKQPRYISFANALVENIAPGCTMVLNQAARDLLINKIPTGIKLHDWWCYLAISALGEIVYDPVPKVLYRTHRNNVSYGGFDGLRKTVGRFKRLVSQDHPVIYLQARTLLEYYSGVMSNEKRDLTGKLLEVRDKPVAERIRHVFHYPFLRQTFFDTLLLQLFLIVNNKAAKRQQLRKGNSVSL